MPRPRILRRADMLKKVRAPAPKRSYRKPKLHIEQVLAWADAHFARTGAWPTALSGEVRGVPWQTWCGVNGALVCGLRGLPKGLNIVRLLWKHRGVRNAKKPPPLTVEEILRWAKAHFARNGQWPTKRSGGVPGVPGQTWYAVEKALNQGLRGLPSGLTLVRLLGQRLGVRNTRRPPPLSVRQILDWSDRHHARTGRWPQVHSGAIHGAPGEKWVDVDRALGLGTRGLKTGASLARLLFKQRGVRNENRPPPLTIAQVLRWADAHHARTGAWPHSGSGPVPGAPGERWDLISQTIAAGTRHVPRGWTLTRLLHEHRGARMLRSPPRLSHRAILKWADAHYRRTGTWPKAHSGAIADAPGETWLAIDACLRGGYRGLSGRSSLARLLERERGARNKNDPAPLTIDQVLAAADSHRRRTGRWPTAGSSPAPELAPDTWSNIDQVLRLGRRGLPAGLSLAQLLEKHRGRPNPRERPRLSTRQILGWADREFRRTGRWPTENDGAIVGRPGEKWKNLAQALRNGRRGLRVQTTLAKLLNTHRRGR